MDRRLVVPPLTTTPSVRRGRAKAKQSHLSALGSKSGVLARPIGTRFLIYALFICCIIPQIIRIVTIINIPFHLFVRQDSLSLSSALIPSSSTQILFVGTMLVSLLSSLEPYSWTQENHTSHRFLSVVLTHRVPTTTHYYSSSSEPRSSPGLLGRNISWKLENFT